MAKSVALKLVLIATSMLALSGCRLNVTVAAGALSLNAHSHNGGVDVAAFNGAAGGQARAQSDNGEVTLRVTPGKGSTVEASSQNGGVVLYLPAGFATDVIDV